MGGYSFDATTNVFTTYDTLSSLSVNGLISAVMNNGTVSVKQISDTRLQVTGGDTEDDRQPNVSHVRPGFPGRLQRLDRVDQPGV